MFILCTILDFSKYSLVEMTEEGRVAAEKYLKGFLRIRQLLQGSLNLPDAVAGEGALAVLESLGQEKLETVLTIQE